MGLNIVGDNVDNGLFVCRYLMGNCYILSLKLLVYS